MSLLETIKTCQDGNNVGVNDLMSVPFIEQIVNNEFDITSKSIEQLSQSLVTYSYLNMDSKKVVDELLWLIGDSEEEFNKWFVVITKGGKFSFNKNIDPIIKNEIIRCIGNPPYVSEKLNVRFRDIMTLNCVRNNNFRLLEWAGENGKLVTRCNDTDSHADMLIEVAKKNSHEEILEWFNINKIKNITLRINKKLFPNKDND
jgi:hypothetical protein